MDRIASGVRALAFLVFAVVCDGCLEPMPCPDGLVPGPSGCVPEDAGHDAGTDALAMGDGCVLLTFYLDEDGDEHGDPEMSTTACDAPDGYVAAGDDCDDGSRDSHPGLTETCDGLDNDCNDRVDEGLLLTFYPDGDGDGHGILGTTMMACTAPAGYAPASDDCDDASNMRFPGNPEVCDAIDNDCDAPMIDETFACVRNATTACVTSCGSTGTGTCSATCTAPAVCNPPAETCATAGEDDDCDGQVDEGVQNFGPRIDLGPTASRVVVVRTDMGYVAFMSRTGGLFARRFSDAGAMVGSEVLIHADASTRFDAYGLGSRILIGWMTGENLVGTVLTSALGPSTPPVNMYVLDGFEGQLRVGVSGSTAMFLFRNGNLGSVDGLRRNWPGLTSLGTSGRAIMGAADDFDATFASSGAFVAARVGSNVRVAHYATNGSATSPLDVGDLSPESFPSLHYTAEHGGVLAVAWLVDLAGTTSDGVRMQTFSAAPTGSLAPLETATLLPGLVRNSVPIELTYTGGRFVAAIFPFTSTSFVPTWNVVDVNAVGIPMPRVTTLESTLDTNTVTAIAAEGTDGTVFVAGTRSGGITRAYRRGCL